MVHGDADSWRIQVVKLSGGASLMVNQGGGPWLNVELGGLARWWSKREQRGCGFEYQFSTNPFPFLNFREVDDIV